MEKVRVFYDKEGNTLNIWFDEPSLEYICEESGDEVIIVKDKKGRVIGFEKLNFLSSKKDLQKARIPLEVVMS
ncbi:MAG: DUF2283 domain-containing protein [bacterium (Candidatus Ratteibacteria) CG_4_10_14_3_um_filter_41_18]|uniref:DUF2283 domain-containing protein n=4 Tax=Candidatus Ratteibacteria TaxID=2979319 RepID=A0A2M7E934_9BACT|nr:MAG: DUF2283 domain-containing protein [bacterium (Candidatus Ratteibacteria) CG01_land_8_20_14_3_00_40_19]PIW34224.1 MAG: DUF2283 domain-containing protein [bacterium (Candidatus Ratteibacteria) CG15_BIG_FIL_POST_REV_8_21_14_020_41_12]PIX77947.1 MAG: DUF2283 domain-containing protein [bacterium (Candidatus Ratteibacteria) CG_4_10_14_3_um_filter_41_18]PJA62079.1 MAG: DUF2283 domain-containing protein [bacterium (Candidatus Ratteibacteria) CG_4_9_14_3_um_filter_41_21]HCG76291.1 DUF2283 domain